MHLLIVGTGVWTQVVPPETVVSNSGAGELFCKGPTSQCCRLFYGHDCIFFFSFLTLLKMWKPILAQRWFKTGCRPILACEPHIICWLILQMWIEGLSTQWACYSMIPLVKSYMFLIQLDFCWQNIPWFWLYLFLLVCLTFYKVSLPLPSAVLLIHEAVIGHLRRDCEDGERATLPVTFTLSLAFFPGGITVGRCDFRPYRTGLGAALSLTD